MLFGLSSWTGLVDADSEVSSRMRLHSLSSLSQIVRSFEVSSSEISPPLLSKIGPKKLQ